MPQLCDIAVVGGGPTGLAAACLIAQGGAKVVLIAEPSSAQIDPRTIALMQPSIHLLEHLGLWPGTLKSRTSPLRQLRLMDDTGALIAAPTVIFSATELGLEAFGWNIPLALLTSSLAAQAERLQVLAQGATANGVYWTGKDVVISITGEDDVLARAVIAADGRNSKLRVAAGIAARQWSYPQTAIATSFAHSRPHRDVSSEYHKPAGPFTTVPMPDGRSSLVWMVKPQRASELMALSDVELAAEIQSASHGEHGLVSDIGLRKSFPMQGLAANRFAARRIFLAGEAAHAVPPIGAQGLNMSLRDVALAAELMLAGDDPGTDDNMTLYDARRQADVQPRQAVIDLMNRSLLSGFLPLAAGRAMSLSLLQWAGPLRRVVMRRGLGPAYGLPRSMQPQGTQPEPIA